jgi:hypothetical protein
MFLPVNDDLLLIMRIHSQEASIAAIRFGRIMALLNSTKAFAPAGGVTRPITSSLLQRGAQTVRSTLNNPAC